VIIDTRGVDEREEMQKFLVRFRPPSALTNNEASSCTPTKKLTVAPKAHKI